MAEDTRQRLLRVGIKRFGREELVRRLDTTGELLDHWLKASPPIPRSKLLTLIDLLDAQGALGDDPQT